MSTIIQLWELPKNQSRPNSVDEAFEIIDMLEDTITNNDKFKMFADDIVLKFPDWRTLYTDDEIISCVWADSPIDGDCDEGVYTIGIRTDYIDEVLDYCIPIAHKYGLNVSEPQLGQCWLSDGSYLSLTNGIYLANDINTKTGTLADEPAVIKNKIIDLNVNTTSIYSKQSIKTEKDWFDILGCLILIIALCFNLCEVLFLHLAEIDITKELLKKITIATMAVNFVTWMVSVTRLNLDTKITVSGALYIYFQAAFLNNFIFSLITIAALIYLLRIQLRLTKT